jgi:hypothetical protein
MRRRRRGGQRIKIINEEICGSIYFSVQYKAQNFFVYLSSASRCRGIGEHFVHLGK